MIAELTDPFPPKDACSVLLSRPGFLEEEMIALFFYQIHNCHLPSPYVLAPAFLRP